MQRLLSRLGISVGMLLTTLASCARPERADVTHVDSAGVSVVINPPLATVRALASLADSAHTVLGGVRSDSSEEFLSRSGYLTAVRMADGRIFAHDATHIKLFAADGKLLSIIGRAGDGPGEFRDIQGLCGFRGDSLVVTDLRGRASLIDPIGTVVRQYPTSGWVVPNACFSDGTVLVAGARTRDPSGSFATVEFKLLSTSGEILGTLPPLPASTYTPVEREVSYAVHRDELYVGDPSEMAVKVYARDGRLRRIVRATDRPVLFRANDPSAVIGEAEIGSKSRVAEIRTPAGAIRPFYSRMRIDATGRIWLRTADHRGADVAWTVIGADGVASARLTLIHDVDALPPVTERWSGQEIIGFGPGEAIVLDRDELGAPRFSFLRIMGLNDNLRE